jgi:hypothetical protein
MPAFLSTALMAGGLSFALAKLSGASTSDSFKSAILGGLGSYATGALGAGLSKTAAEGVLKESLTAGLKGSVAQTLPSGMVDQTLKGVTSVGGLSTVPAAATDSISKNFFTKAMERTGSFLQDPSKQFATGVGIGGSYAMDKLNQPTGPKIDPNNPYNLSPEQRQAMLDTQTDRLSGLTQRFDYAAAPQEQVDPYDFGSMLYAKEGAFVEGIAQYAKGGVNYLPSKLENDEKDINNYVRARGYVEDGSGIGDKDEDTMLAQLADGEFVSRADAILGAGIMAGANPEDFKDMRKKGAAFFYNQQDQLKRVFDLVNGN